MKINVTNLSNAIAGFQQCKEGYKQVHEDTINKLCELLPSGSGIDAGIKFLWEYSTPEKIIFSFGFHHLDDNGYYDGWTAHKIIIAPSLQHGFNIKITGRDRRYIKDYLYDLLSEYFEI